MVNMTSQELSEWLRTDSAAENTEELPERSGTPDGRAVLAVLQKRRTDLTDKDLRVMREVVRTVGEQRRGDLEPVAGQKHWRRRLMRLGHDPLKPPR
ncbi:DUF3140 domain-containing protein [Streptomyces alkaliterrae]|uniref:DUF3140 domain-containing protein n=1 Tax=Streptomyces alkaliterrae TaxID=2213162 RepID=A0A5P0YSH0_9ACTN|nr:DUF3140 domain-containing protein [Streptomyces alkaliterrae]MBB1253454.1 DUF3140 domain-containing protein [Streptomyces alkaliterrae]MBB1259420.1 DUF3140 domain-containing protein [Streptomyces alkaliterrae]MQS03271.1 DUF3140 domain-containing protein [Streptomyces alkaliterrae]